MKRILGLLFSLLAFTACDSGMGEGNGDDNNGVQTSATIKDYDSTLLSQVVYADDASGKGDFTFTATDDWETSIKNIASEDVKTYAGSDMWISVNPASGSAGKVTMSIVIQPNDTGTSRKAEIKVSCGESEIKITVEQKAITKDEDPNPDPAPEPDPEPTPDDKFEKFVKKLSYEKTNSTGWVAFEYDAQKRIVKIDTYDSEEYGGKTDVWTSTGMFTYDGDKVRINVRFEDDSENVVEIKLDKNGYATKYVMTSMHADEEAVLPNTEPKYIPEYYTRARRAALYSSGDEHAYSDISEYFYDNNNCLTKMTSHEWCEYDGDYDYANYMVTWNDGNIAKVSYSSTEKPVSYADNIVYSSAVNNPKCNFDLSYYLSDSFAYSSLGDIPGLFGYLGKRSKLMPGSVTQTFVGEYSDTVNYRYTLDKDGYITECEASFENSSKPEVKKTYSVQYY